MGLKHTIKKAYNKSPFVFWLVNQREKISCALGKLLYSDKAAVAKQFQKVFGRPIDWNNPKTLNEKIQWLKVNEHDDFHTVCADKYAVRDYLAKEFGEEYLIPLVFHTDKASEVTPENITEFPCIIKANHTSGNYKILRSVDEVDWPWLRRYCKYWLGRNYYWGSREWQYKNIKRQIVVEQLLQTKSGKIPNDYKLHYINGKLAFVYCSVDREGGNKRNIYDANWQPLYFSWVAKKNTRDDLRGEEIPAPKSFDKMKEIGSKIAERFKYVRVDFYDVDGKLYFGEITLHHGGGFDVFTPEKYDTIYGEMLQL